ncbi:MAG: phosphate ABC transporter permease PstA [Candidatus Methanosuratincola petrocarbonis]|jgi:phosphate transport system permease protein|uniref:Phosphate transport system permease protein PstA n=1 Tax=Methanosuratincola subterraneus TaxID=2593994 RepID=A0A3S3RFD1_METS7|nr:phosphate ABC transporter permease PstA [Candidatus Methanosuratincola sp.]RWX74132.1 MAG: Phosphate transport system permease protein PstA [Candidatus Methanosuratincola subterraneus]
MIVSRRTKEKLIIAALVALTGAAVVPLFWIIGSIVWNGISVMSLEFLTSLPAPFGSSGGGIGNAILGTLIINLFASGLGIPLGILTGIYLAEYAHDSRMGSAVRTIVESLSGVPSLVIGLFAFTLIVLSFRHYTGVAATLALGIMMIPLVAKATEESMRVVSDDLREAGMALGIPKYNITTRIVLSMAKGGVISGSLLAFARISGETAPLLFTALFSFYWPTGIDQPMATLQVLIYNYAISGFADWVAKAWGASLLLVLLVITINVAVRYLGRKKYGGA